MKYLMVDNGRVFYSLDGSAASKNPIDQISKDDLLTLLKIAISEESFEMDPYSTESVHNAAHQIIYKNIYQKFEDIRSAFRVRPAQCCPKRCWLFVVLKSAKPLWGWALQKLLLPLLIRKLPPAIPLQAGFPAW